MNRSDNATLAQSIGSVIKALRQKKYPNHGGQIKCAQEFGVSQAEWSRWERGIKIPSPANQRAIADFFGVSIAQLYGENVRIDDDSDNGISSLLSVYRKAYNINQLLNTLVQNAEQNSSTVGETEETLELVLGNLKTHVEQV